MANSSVRSFLRKQRQKANSLYLKNFSNINPTVANQYIIFGGIKGKQKYERLTLATLAGKYAS